MYAIILAGGSGTRLWPLSRELYPKQFMPLPGEQLSLLQSTVVRVAKAVGPEKIIIVTHIDQSVEIRRQLAQLGMAEVRLLEEPQSRNTAPAIGLAARFLQKETGHDTVMAVLPADHLIPNHDQFAMLMTNGCTAAGKYGLVTFGITPTYPETGYGYIYRGEMLDQIAYQVERFVEKPTQEKAEQYLKDECFLWNSGMFVFRIDALLEQYRLLLPEMHALLQRIDFSHPDQLAELYQTIPAISIDYGILEKASGIAVVPAKIDWSDLGSWEAYYQVSKHDDQGNYQQGRVINVDSTGSLILSDYRLVAAVGLQDLVVIDTPDALLICSRDKSQDIRQVVDRLNSEDAVEAREHRTIFRPWGSYTALEAGAGYQVKRLNVNPGSRLSLQSHRHRSENWVVVQGEALVTVDQRQLTLQKGETVYIPTGTRHRLENRGSIPLALIEVQNGDYLGEDDIERYEDDYGRVQPAAAGKTEQQVAINHYRKWLEFSGLDPEMREQIQLFGDDPELIESHFGRTLAFGTGGMRGLLGPGLNRINQYTIRRATQGLANYLNSRTDGKPDKQVAIAFDPRHCSREFARQAARVLAANGIRTLLFDDIRPTPLLSYATRMLGCVAGIVITASHNPPEYNGYKVYGPDGGQAVSPLVDELVRAIEAVEIFSDVKILSAEEAEAAELIQTIDQSVDQSYLSAVAALSLYQPGKRIRVVYTPLHGTGAPFIPAILEQTGYVDLHLVTEQAGPDPQFSTVRTPNPEDPAALKMALAQAARVEADLVMATDPDGDRIGAAIRERSGIYRILTGNQVGALLIEYLCSQLASKGAMPEQPALVKTIVTGSLGSRIAEAYGLQVYDTLTGFKYIGEQIKKFEEQGWPAFVFGYEESCGYLAGTFVRDKDAVISALLIAEMTAFYLEQDLLLTDVLEQLQQKYGYHREELVTVELNDIAEAERYLQAYKNLPLEFGGFTLAIKCDYEQGKGYDLLKTREFNLDLPQSPVLHYTMKEGSWFAVRPSGTEPKLKFYLSAVADTDASAQQSLSRLKAAVLSIG